MLIFTRKKGEKICIGDNIEIILLGINGNQARIGLKAPRDIPIHREEIYKKIQEAAKDNTNEL